jgi:hypothetical protein
MEGLVCLCLEAAPGYISLAVSAHPRPPATIASPLHTLFHTVPSSPSLSQRLQILDKSCGLGYNPLVCEGPRSSLSLKRPPHLHYHCATRFFYLIPFTHLLLTLDSSGVLPTFAIDYDPLLYEAPSKFILFSPPSIPQFFTRPSTLHTTLHTTVDSSHTRRLMNSIDHRIAKLRRHRDRCLRLLTTRHPATEAALGSVWFKQYRKAQDKIDCLQRQVSRLVKLCRHRDRCLRFLTNRYPTLEAAKGSKRYQQYRAAEVRIDCLQRQA